jgi:hypothetical protein
MKSTPAPSVDLLPLEGGGRLVQYQQVVGIAPVGERPDDRDDRALRRRQLGDRHGDVEVAAEAADQLFRPAPFGAAVAGRDRARGEAAPERQVLHRGQSGNQTEVLVDEVEGGACVAAAEHLAVGAEHLDRAGVHLIDAGQHLHQGRLAGAVLADHGDDLPGSDLEREIGQRLGPGEGLGDARDPQQGAGVAGREGPLRAPPAVRFRGYFPDHSSVNFSSNSGYPVHP